jgi:hypothetical protein
VKALAWFTTRAPSERPLDCHAVVVEVEDPDRQAHRRARNAEDSFRDAQKRLPRMPRLDESIGSAYLRPEEEETGTGEKVTLDPSEDVPGKRDHAIAQALARRAAADDVAAVEPAVLQIEEQRVIRRGACPQQRGLSRLSGTEKEDNLVLFTGCRDQPGFEASVIVLYTDHITAFLHVFYAA